MVCTVFGIVFFYKLASYGRYTHNKDTFNLKSEMCKKSRCPDVPSTKEELALLSTKDDNFLHKFDLLKSLNYQCSQDSQHVGPLIISLHPTLCHYNNIV